MKLVLVCHQSPFPADNGAKLRTLHLARQLARRHQVALLCPPHPATDAAALQAQLGPHSEVLLAPLAPEPALYTAARLASLRPRGVLRANTSPLALTLAQQVQRWQPDALLASDPIMGEYLRPYAGLTRIVDIAQEYGLYFPRLARTQHPAKRILWRLRQAKWAAYTRNLAPHVDLWMVPGAVDRASLVSQLPASAQVAIIPNGVDVAANPYMPNTNTPPQICHTGALSYEPNRDGLEFFFGAIWPLIRARCPQLTMLVTGKSEGAPAYLRQAPGVTLTGYVAAVRPIVTGSRALVVPLRLGVGTRLKIMEAMALGTPVVSTAIGAEGLDVTDRQNILLADTPLDFTECVAEVVASPALRAQLSQGGRQLVEERYAWDVIGASALAALDAIKRRVSHGPHPQTPSPARGRGGRG